MIEGFFIGFAVLHGIYGFLLWRGWRAATGTPLPPASRPDALPPLSVIVAAHHEATMLPGLLEALKRQTHPSYEVVIVNDHSTDETEAIVRSWQKDWPELRLIQASGRGKKAAIQTGIVHARHELLVFTDADCSPPPRWLERMALFHRQFPESVAVGYGPMFPRPTWLNRLIRFETTITAFLTAAAIGLHRPFMAVGRNLSYPRSIFERVGGFASHATLLSGDDDLFIQDVYRKHAGTIRYLYDPETFVYSHAPSSWRAWIRQKRRHTSASRRYRRSIQVHLALLHLSYVCTWFAPLFLGTAGWLLPSGLLLARGLLARRFFPPLACNDLLPYFPLLDIAYLGYTLFIAPLGVLFGSRRWS